MTIAVDLGRKETKQTNKQILTYNGRNVVTTLVLSIFEWILFILADNKDKLLKLG